ncbi:MAG: hypothetical protein KC486_32360, partial [Myxococcales bacterium]|nr:hypothetical protein [Myxococcales bacterium]
PALRLRHRAVLRERARTSERVVDELRRRPLPPRVLTCDRHRSVMDATPPLRSFLAHDLREGLSRWWALAKRATLIVTALFAVPFVVVALAGIADTGVATTLLALAANVVVAAVYAAFVGLVVATTALLWRLFGAALIAAAVLAPLAFFAVLWLMGPWVVVAGALTIELWAEAIAASPSMSFDPTPMLGAGGHAGPAILLIFAVVLLPVVVLWVGKAIVLLVVPPVLWALLGLVAAVTATIALSLAAALVIAAPILGIALFRRFRRRRREHLEAHAAAAQRLA